MLVGDSDAAAVVHHERVRLRPAFQERSARFRRYGSVRPERDHVDLLLVEVEVSDEAVCSVRVLDLCPGSDAATSAHQIPCPPVALGFLLLGAGFFAPQFGAEGAEQLDLVFGRPGERVPERRDAQRCSCGRIMSSRASKYLAAWPKTNGVGLARA